MLPIVLVAIGAVGGAVTGTIGSGIAHKIKSKNKIEEQTILSGDSTDYPKVLVCGATGAGKSSLINSAFGVKVARVGEGASVTRGINQYCVDDKELVIFDCEGFTLGNVHQYQRRINLFFNQYDVDAVWYCINAGSKRLLDADMVNIKQLRECIDVEKIRIVITKVDTVSQSDLTDLISLIKKHFPGLYPVKFSNDPKLSNQAAETIEFLIDKLSNADF